MNSKLQILLVEDDSQDADYIREVLDFHHGDSYLIRLCSRLAEAGELASSERFDIILTDLNLPDSSGLESFDRLFQFFPDTPIVVLTGPNDSETGRIAVRNGAQDFLVKSEITGDTLNRSLSYAIERKKIKDTLEETNALKELLLDVITHDLKNDAGTVFGMSEILQQKVPENELIELIKDSSQRIIQVIDNASTLAKISAGEKIFQKELDLNHILAEVIEEFADSLKANDMELVFQAADEAIIHANPIIAEVFKNFISNAIRYSSDGKRIMIDIRSKNDRIRVRVSDQGATIPADKRDTIFQRRIQLEGGSKHGSGLGLAIVKRIAEIHQGKVWMEPFQDRGNSFCIELNKVQGDGNGKN